MKEEIWKVIEGYPNYEVSNLGRVRNIKFDRVRKPMIDKDGYLYVVLSLNGKTTNNKIHRLVASAFIPNPENKREVNHINGIKTDNRVENLEWNTRSENIRHAHKTGLKRNLNGGKPKQRVRCIETGQIFETQNQASKYFDCIQGSISQSINRGYKVLKKYHFELV